MLPTKQLTDPFLQILICFFHWRKAIREQLGKKHVEQYVHKKKRFIVIYRVSF